MGSEVDAAMDLVDLVTFGDQRKENPNVTIDKSEPWEIDPITIRCNGCILDGPQRLGWPTAATVEYCVLREAIDKLVMRVAELETAQSRALAIAKGAAKMSAQHRDVLERDGVAFCSATGCGAPTDGKDRCADHADGDWRDAPDLGPTPSWVHDKAVR